MEIDKKEAHRIIRASGVTDINIYSIKDVILIIKYIRGENHVK